MKVGLRIDVDTYRGTKYGVPSLCRILSARNINASFFFSVGPDNMGRHLWRLLRPKFLYKMLRTNASSLYGWDILFKGTFWPGPVIGKKTSDIIRSARDAGHEVGFHAWDHHYWQAHLDNMTYSQIYHSLNRGVELLTQILESPPICSAAPGWKCNDAVLSAKSKFPFKYNSDCRGESIFYPVVDGKRLRQPQIPVTLPTYDELIGRNGINNENYNERLISLLSPEKLNVLTVHAEAEGIALHDIFQRFLDLAKERDCSFVPLGALIDEASGIKNGTIAAKEIAGREGWGACQSSDAAKG